MALPWPTSKIVSFAVPLDLTNVAAHRSPSSNLSPILIRYSATKVVSAIPLEPAAGIVGVDPTLSAPDRQRLAGVNAEVVEAVIASLGRKLCADEPAAWKLVDGVGHVLAAEYAEAKHLVGCQVGIKIGIKIAPRRLAQDIAIALLHLVVNSDDPVAHFLCKEAQIGPRPSCLNKSPAAGRKGSGGEIRQRRALPRWADGSVEPNVPASGISCQRADSPTRT